MISSWDIDAEFSPDGRTLAFSSSRSGEAMEIGYFAGRRWWYWTGLIVPSQVTTMMLRGGEISGLWPLMVVLASILGTPFLLAAFIASRLRPRG